MNATLVVRIALTAFTAFLAAALAIALYVIPLRELNAESALPSPARVAAIISLLESVPADEKGIVLQVLATPQLAVWLNAPPVSQRAAVRPRRASLKRLLEAYRRAVPGRHLELAVANSSQRTGPVWRFVMSETNAHELRVRLIDGEEFVLRSKELLPISALGLPFGFGAGIVGTLIAVAMLIFLHRQVRPLRDLARAVENTDFNSEPQEIPEVRSAAPEIQTLVGAFNRQQARLARLIESRLTLVGGLQHDVRTFATKLRLRLEGSEDPVVRDQGTSDLDDIVQLLDDALLATQGTTSSAEPVLEMVDVEELLRSEIRSREDDRVRLVIAPASSSKTAYTLGDRLALRRVFANLLDNALAYGDYAEVGVCTTQDSITVAIDDDGPGIPQAMRDMVCEPFVRLENSRARATGGSGLGLAIVANLVAQSEGRFEIADAPSGGARMIVEVNHFQPGGTE
ncbi:MAG: ATP-binding protein [Pseudomonadota bacterium]